MLTPFGRALRKHRIDKNISLRDMAKKMGVAASFLSAVEHGRKSIPTDLPDRVALALHLDLEERTKLGSEVERSQKEHKISVGSSSSDFDRELVAVFARQFGGLDDERKEQIMRILKDEK